MTQHTTDDAGIAPSPPRGRRDPRRLLDSLSPAGRKGLVGFGWSGMTQVVIFAIKLVSTVILARWLSPKDYGLFGVAILVVTTLEWFSDLGVPQALMRHPQGGTRAFLDTGWWITVFRGLGLMAACLALSWPLSRIYGLPEIFPVLAAMSAASLLASLRSPGMPMLRRALDYRSLFFINTFQAGAGFAAAVAVALVSPTVWAIVVSTLVGYVASVAASYVFAPQRPAWGLDPHAVRELSHLSRQIFVNTLIMALWLNSDRLIGALFVPPETLGIYVMASSLAAIVEMLTMHAADVYYSMLVRTDDPDGRARLHAQVLGRVARWGMPALALTVLAAPLAVRVLYDDRYQGAALPFAILTTKLMVRLFAMLHYQYIQSNADIRSATLGYVAAAIAQVALLLSVGRIYGIMGFAACGLVTTTLQAAVQIGLSRSRVAGEARSFAIVLGYAAVAVAAGTALYRVRI